MGFDDLARHMASRDGQTVPVGDADQVVADAQKIALRMGRRSDVILGLVLLVGGLVILGLFGLTVLDLYNPTPSYLRPTNGKEGVPIYIAVAGAGAVIVGLQKLLRGSRGVRGDGNVVVSHAVNPRTSPLDRRRGS